MQFDPILGLFQNTWVVVSFFGKNKVLELLKEPQPGKDLNPSTCFWLFGSTRL